MNTAPENWLPIRTERLILREFRHEDVEAVHRYGGDPVVTRYTWWGPNTLEESRAAVGRSLADQCLAPRLNFGIAIELASSGCVIGSFGLEICDEPNRTAEIGYCLHQAHWRRGIITEAGLSVIDAAFFRLGLHRLYATCDARNVGSWGVMEKLGMRREGSFRRDRLVKGEWRDSYLYALLADEWRPIRL